MRDPAHDYVTEKDIGIIAGFMPVYRLAARRVGDQTPLMLASLHFRENDLRPTCKIPGGPYQFDPGRGEGQIQSRIKAHVVAVCLKYRLPYQPVNRDFYTATLVAADWMKYKSRGRPLATKNNGNILVVADTLWGYNGRSGWHTSDGAYSRENRSWRFSPYVSNDPKRGIRLKMRGTIPDGHGGRKVLEYIDNRPGSLVIYRELKRKLPELLAAERAIA